MLERLIRLFIFINLTVFSFYVAYSIFLSDWQLSNDLLRLRQQYEDSEPSWIETSAIAFWVVTHPLGMILILLRVSYGMHLYFSGFAAVSLYLAFSALVDPLSNYLDVGLSGVSFLNYIFDFTYGALTVLVFLSVKMRSEEDSQ